MTTNKIMRKNNNVLQNIHSKMWLLRMIFIFIVIFFDCFTAVPVESMLPMPPVPVGYQLVREPTTGQYIFLPTATSIGMSKMLFSSPYKNVFYKI